MNIDFVLATFPAAVGTLLGGTIAFLLFRMIIARRYEAIRQHSRHANFKYWCGALAFIAIAQGLMTTINEVIFSWLNDAPIEQNKIFLATIGLVVFPIIFYLVQLILSSTISETNFSREESNKPTAQSPSSREPEGTSQTSTSQTRFSTKGILSAISFSVAFVLVILFRKDFFADERRFELVECSNCRTSGGTGVTDCKENKSGLPFFVVSEGKVAYKGVDPQGRVTVTEYPSADTKCIFRDRGKFSFACSSQSTSEQYKSEYYQDFDGVSATKSGSRHFVFINGEFRLLFEDKNSCKVRH